MASKLAIVNLALSHLASGKEVANFETEASEEARTARRFYEVARDATLRDFPWPFATKIAALALIEEEPNTEWAFSYRIPTDCVYLRRILSGLRNDSRDTRAPYKLGQDSSGLLLYTDEEDAQAEYTVKSENTEIYPSDFAMAFSYYLAMLMAPRLTSGDQFKLGERAMRLYQFEIGRAVSRGFNEEQGEEEPASESIRARD